MPKFTLLNVRQFAGGADLTTRSNKVELSSEVEDKDATAFVPTGDVWKEVLGGLRDTSWSSEGQWEAGDPGKVDDAMFAALGAANALTVCPRTAGVGELAWLTGAMNSSYMLGSDVGNVAPWSASGKGSWPLARGLVLHDPGTARTATGSGTAVAHVAAGTGQYVYAALHVLSVAGTATPTITVKVQSDNGSGFPSPADVLTFTAATARGGQIMRVAGPVTDTFYRASWTITGTSPSFLFLVSMGIA